MHPFVWAVHDDTGSPHAHVVFVDKDVETGRRVAKLSEASSAHKWRKVWEDCCNRALDMAGSVARVSRWGKHSPHHQLLNERARYERKRAVLATEALSITAVDTERAIAATACPQKPPQPKRSVEVEHWQVDHKPADERDMDAVIKQDEEMPSISAVVAFVASQMAELDRLRAARQSIADYRAAYAEVNANLMRSRARLDALDPELRRASSRVLKTEQEVEAHRGVLNWFWQIVSPAARARARAARTAKSMAIYTLTTTRIKANNLLREAQTLQGEQKALLEKANALKTSLAIYGSDDEVDVAEKVLVRTIAVNTAELSAVELSQAVLEGHITRDEHRQLVRALDKGGIEI